MEYPFSIGLGILVLLVVVTVVFGLIQYISWRFHRRKKGKLRAVLRGELEVVATALGKMADTIPPIGTARNLQLPVRIAGVEDDAFCANMHELGVLSGQEFEILFETYGKIRARHHDLRHRFEPARRTSEYVSLPRERIPEEVNRMKALKECVDKAIAVLEAASKHEPRHWLGGPLLRLKCLSEINRVELR